jgi:hypothetical protein
MTKKPRYAVVSNSASATIVMPRKRATCAARAFGSTP